MIFNQVICKPRNDGTAALQPIDKIVRPVTEDSVFKMDEIDIVVRMVTSETSEKYVPSPRRDNVLGDLLIGLKRFNNVTRWK